MSCEYCDAREHGRGVATRDLANWADNGGPMLYMTDEAEIVLDWPDKTEDTYGFTASFCPKCGRDLREAGE